MTDEKISWGWVARILWGVLWRWIVSAVAITFAVIIVLVIYDKVISGHSGPRDNTLLGGGVLILWFVALFWAIAATLRARHGGYRLMPVSDQTSINAFD